MSRLQLSIYARTVKCMWAAAGYGPAIRQLQPSTCIGLTRLKCPVILEILPENNCLAVGTFAFVECAVCSAAAGH